MDTKEFSRKELDKLIWTNPITTISEKYKISTYQIRKACLETEIPL